MSEGELILYTTEDGEAAIQLRAVDGTVWLSQLDMAELFQTTKQNVSLHVRNILAEREMEAEATVKEYLTVQAEGKRQVTMAKWPDKLDTLLSFDERAVLPHTGRRRMEVTQGLAVERFVVLDANRHAAEALAADEGDIAQLEHMEIVPKGPSKGAKDA